MMNNGQVVLNISGDEKKNLTVEDHSDVRLPYAACWRSIQSVLDRLAMYSSAFALTR